ncbi:uncharacterized protein VTP21DRAFT_6367 [Calcarisporiella thermophila]|uniref:uncharacterized protein n=1 Tax=Calcarisporiella thermophila TaxID=911321 RepID=UPI003741E9AC
MSSQANYNTERYTADATSQHASLNSCTYIPASKPLPPPPSHGLSGPSYPSCNDSKQAHNAAATPEIQHHLLTPYDSSKLYSAPLAPSNQVNSDLSSTSEKTTLYQDDKPWDPIPAMLSRWFPRFYRSKHSQIILTLLGLLLFLANTLIILGALGYFTGEWVPQDFGYPGFPMSGEGDGTYYDPGVGLTACEQNWTSSDFVAALNKPDFGTFINPLSSPACNQCIIITGPKGSVKVKIVDICPTCKHGDIDMTPAAFDRIGDLNAGRIRIQWQGC